MIIDFDLANKIRFKGEFVWSRYSEMKSEQMYSDLKLQMQFEFNTKIKRSNKCQNNSKTSQSEQRYARRRECGGEKQGSAAPETRAVSGVASRVDR